MKKLKLFSTILLIALLASMFIVPASALEDPAPGAKCVILIDRNTGNPLYAKNEAEQVVPASLTKIMTVFLAVEAIEKDGVDQYAQITAGQSMVSDLVEDGSSAGIVVGETMTLNDLMYCAMIKSANEACNVIAEYIAGSIPKFVALMNERAAQLGCTGTSFANTHGLPAANHYTTASDLALITQAALMYPLFEKICNTKEITIAATNKSQARHLVTTNGLINNDADPYKGYYYEYASGVKTGHTEAAGYCLVSTAAKNGMNLLCVVLGGKTSSTPDGLSYGNFTDSVKLYNWAFDNFSYRDIIKITDIIETVPVVMGADANEVSVHPLNAVTALLPKDDDLQSFKQNITIFSVRDNEPLVAPVSAGVVLGEVSITREGVVYGTSPLVASTSIELSYSQYLSGRIKQTLKKPAVVFAIIVIAVLVLGYVFLVVRYQVSKKDYLKKHPQARKAVRAPQAQKQKKSPPPEVKPKAPAPEAKPKAPASKIKQPVQKLPRIRPESARKMVPPPPQDEIDYFNMLSGGGSTDGGASSAQAEKDYFEEFFGKKD